MSNTAKSLLDSLTLGDIRELRGVLLASGTGKTQADTHMQPGESVIIRTVTNYFVGRVDSITAGEVKLSDASWVADTGRYSDALTKGGQVFNDVERLPHGVCVRLGSMVDWSPWKHELPKETK